jgi:lysozyme family protein
VLFQQQKYSKDIIEEMHDLWQDFLEGLLTFKHYGRGWTTRNAHVKDTALDIKSFTYKNFPLQHSPRI